MAKQINKKELEKEITKWHEVMDAVSKNEIEVLTKKTFSPRVQVYKLRSIKRYFVTETTESFLTRYLMELIISNDKRKEIIFGCPSCKRKWIKIKAFSEHECINKKGSEKLKECYG